jgi:hypothetical protein
LPLQIAPDGLAALTGRIAPWLFAPLDAFS